MGIGRFFTALLVCAVVASSQAQAQSSRTIKIIVPSTAGGGADVLARMLADQIGKAQSQTMVVENRPGAGNTIGTEAVARAAADGNTLLITTPEFVINPHLRKLNYDPLTSFAPICYLARSPQLILVNPATPYNTLADLLDDARRKPGELTVASAGPASSPHVGIERIKHDAKVDFTFVPFQGSGPALNALLGQHVTAAMASYPNVTGQVRGGQLRAIAVASLSRVDDLPNVPTVQEAGFKDFDLDIWFGVVAPAGTPPDTLAQLTSWFKAALQDPEILAKLKAQGLFPVGACGDDYAAFTRKQFDDYGRGIREANIKPN
ncbi:Bug family tripartite tricarboxylate transporter substrate binding protein [Rhodoplanes sp. Z2-YC6860]|uniref:Bug family tripartite tricarboxylate transporter substrate binding protein n=1 Tax=Rhodoplanes sp. Z2-YC6860 TaxID=674703 RepID=UPI00078EE888|nr:tripartite tricarboxylate transporter substrate binding protein [Rhodoplanes sp. Z2-YC6860]AMN40935.1 extra-cytoplasmic solute receptor [Rhodoplanes sp. Z2-YC6860]